MEASQDAVQGRAGEAIARMRHDIDDARMRTGREHDDTLILDAHGDEPLVHEEGIRLPIRPVFRTSVVSREPGFEWRDPRNLAAEVKQVVENQLRLAGLHDAGAMPLEHRSGRNVFKWPHGAISGLDR